MEGKNHIMLLVKTVHDRFIFLFLHALCMKRFLLINRYANCFCMNETKLGDVNVHTKTRTKQKIAIKLTLVFISV
jgi:hypothetical protein